MELKILLVLSNPKYQNTRKHLMTNQLPNSTFDYNLLNSLFDILELTQEDKKELAEEVVQAVLQRVIVESNFDVARINELGNAGKYNELAEYLSTQIQDKEKFIVVFEEAMISLVSVLLDEFYQVASPEQQEKMNNYLAEYQLQTQFIS